MAGEFFLWQLVKQGVTLAAPHVGRWVGPLLLPTWYHRRQVRERLQEMPFIYHNLVDGGSEKAEVLSGFVEVDVSLAGPRGEARKPVPAAELPGHLRRGRIIFFGNAGAGKTTLLRYVTLSILSNEPPYRFPRKLVPVFVPMKALDSTQDRPILSYIRRNVPYGWLGAAWLKWQAWRGRVLLLLDGYDEVPSTAASKVASELFRLFTESQPPFYALLQGRFDRFATARGPLRLMERLRRENYVWLTSRAEYLDAHFPVPGDDGRDRPYLPMDLLKVEGVATNREQLVARIFSRYASREALSPTRFLQMVDSMDGEGQQLSYNPLFLTVMCYVYTKERLGANAGDVDTLHTFDETIERCMRLLVRDRDNERARKLPEEQRALLLARNQHPDEKDAFLRAFAGRLYADERNLFDAEYLRRSALHFFSGHPTPYREQIVQELQSSAIGRGEDVMTELIYAGMFVRQSGGEGGTLYDFPHRRFREVLAWRYYEAHPDALLENAGKVFWRELILFVFARSRHARPIFGRLLELAVADPGQPHSGQLAADCYASVETRDSALAEALRGALSDFVEARLADGRAFRLPSSLLKALAEDDGWVDLMTGRLADRLRNGKRGVKLLCEVVSIVNVNALKRELERLWESRATVDEEPDVAVLLKYTFREVPLAAAASALALRGDARAADWMAHCLVWHCRVKDPGPEFLKPIVDVLDPDALQVFVTRLEREDFSRLYRTVLGLLRGFDLDRLPRIQSATGRSDEAKRLPDLTGSPYLQEFFDTRATVV